MEAGSELHARQGGDPPKATQGSQPLFSITPRPGQQLPPLQHPSCNLPSAPCFAVPMHSGSLCLPSQHPPPSPAQHPAAGRARRALQAWRWAASDAQAITCAEIPLPRAVCSGEAVAVFSCTASPRRAAEFGHFLTTIVLIHFFSAESGCVQFNAAGRKGKGTPGAEASPVTQQPRRKKRDEKKRGKTQPQPTQREAFLIF